MNAINGAVSVWGGGMFHATVMHAGRYQVRPLAIKARGETEPEDPMEKKNSRGGT
jgi:hypothetical protein